MGQGEINVAFKGLVLAVEVHIDHLWNELAGESNDESVGDDRDPPQGLHDVKPDSNTANLAHFNIFYSLVSTIRKGTIKQASE